MARGGQGPRPWHVSSHDLASFSKLCFVAAPSPCSLGIAAGPQQPNDERTVHEPWTNVTESSKSRKTMVKFGVAMVWDDHPIGPVGWNAVADILLLFFTFGPLLSSLFRYWQMQQVLILNVLCLCWMAHWKHAEQLPNFSLCLYSSFANSCNASVSNFLGCLMDSNGVCRNSIRQAAQQLVPWALMLASTWSWHVCPAPVEATAPVPLRSLSNKV